VELDGELAGNCPVDFQMHEKPFLCCRCGIAVARHCAFQI